MHDYAMSLTILKILTMSFIKVSLINHTACTIVGMLIAYSQELQEIQSLLQMQLNFHPGIRPELDSGPGMRHGRAVHIQPGGAVAAAAHDRVGRPLPRALRAHLAHPAGDHGQGGLQTNELH